MTERQNLSESKFFHLLSGDLRIDWIDNKILMNKYHPKKDERLYYTVRRQDGLGTLNWENNLGVEFFYHGFNIWAMSLPKTVRLSGLPLVNFWISSIYGNIEEPQIYFFQDNKLFAADEQKLIAKSIEVNDLTSGGQSLKVSFGSHKELIRYRIDSVNQAAYFKFSENKNSLALSLYLGNLNKALAKVRSMASLAEEKNRDFNWSERVGQQIEDIRNDILVVNPQIEV